MKGIMLCRAAQRLKVVTGILCAIAGFIIMGADTPGEPLTFGHAAVNLCGLIMFLIPVGIACRANKPRRL